ncbi:MAG: response regulator [Bdellovibrionota bacterium]
MSTWNKKTRVLIVDDNESDRLILRSMLIAIGFAEIHEAEDGVMAESKINISAQIKQPFEIVFVDWMMPKLNGLKLLQHIRADKTNLGMIVFMTTSKTQHDAVTDAAKAGVNEYMIKPLTLDLLRTKIEKHFAPEKKAK